MQSVQTSSGMAQARASRFVGTGYEELQSLDGELARQARSAGALRFAIALGLQALAKGGYRELGFRSMAAYALERCERRSRWTEQSLALARKSASLPLLRAALLSGRLSWSKAVIVAGVATPGDEAEWLAAAGELSARKLKERARRRAGTSEPDEGDVAVEDDEDARCTLTVTVNTEEAWLFECATLVVRHLDGTGVPMASVVEAAIGEGMSSLVPRVPRDAIELPEQDETEAAQRAYLAQREEWRGEAEELCESRVLQAPEVRDCGVDATVPVDGAPEALDAEVRRRAVQLAELSAQVGALAEVFFRADGWRRLGYATDRQYARERLGASLSSLKEKRALARGIRRLPRVAESMRAGRIGFEAARQVMEVATPSSEESWVGRAEERTLVHLREEVQAAGLLARIGLNGDDTGQNCDARPPSVEMMTALRRLEERIVTGQISAGTPCSDALEQALAREGRPSRSLRSKGRTTLRLRVSRGLRQTYRWLERLYARHRRSSQSFLAYCCSELLRVWAHARPPVAYGSVYARDGYRCANPVCGVSQVTPHHVMFRSHGGSDEDTNVTSLCVECHLEGVHGGRVEVTGNAPDLRWALGRNRHTAVHGRRRVREPVTPC
jgi:hypothetical protein